MKKFLTFGILILLTAGLAAQTPVQSLRIQWEIEGPQVPPGETRPPFDVATAQSYTYKVYMLGAAVGTALTGVQCTTTADEFIKTCSTTLPPTFDIPGADVDMTATISGLETIHSASVKVPPKFIPPNPPTNPRIIRIVVPASPTGVVK